MPKPKNSKPQPLARFKVRVDPKGKQIPGFFWCSIWHNITQARARMEKLANNASEKFGDTFGACLSWDTLIYDGDSKDNGILKPEMGEIVLAIRWSGGSIISHECAHAAFRLNERIDIFHIKDDQTKEERFCLTVGLMFRQIARRLIRLDKELKEAEMGRSR